MTNPQGKYPIRTSTIYMFFVLVGLMLGVGIDIFCTSSDEIETVKVQVETLSDTLEVKPTLIEF